MSILLIIALILFSFAARAESLRFNTVLQAAIETSYDLKIAKSRLNASKSGIKEAKSEYFPSLTAGYNSQYDKDLTDGTSTITSVGDTILLDSSIYQNSLSLNVQYKLFDFGIRKRKLRIAKKERDQKEVEYDKILRDLKIEIVDLYTKALLTHKELNTNNEILSLHKKLFGMHEKLYNSGTVRKTDVMEQALKVAKLTNQIDIIKTDFKKILEDLSYYTEQEYKPDNIELLRLNQEEFIPVSYVKPNVLKIEAQKINVLDLESLPEYKVYQLEIEKKQAELQILNRQRLPHFNFLTSYYLYGTDPDNYFSSYSDLAQRNLSFRINSSLPLFDGFKNKAQRDRINEEINTLKLERDKKIKDIKSYYKKLSQESADFEQKFENQQNSLKLVEEKLSMLEKLNSQGLIDEIQYLSQKSDLTTLEFNLEKTVINNDAAEYKIKVLRKRVN